MRASARCRMMLRSIEKLRLVAYLDTGKVPTIGWGHTKGVKLGDSCTAEIAEAWFDQDLDEHEGSVMRLLDGVPLTQAMFDALVSFEYNTGGLAGSKALRALREKRWCDAGEILIQWNMDDGVPLQGLFRRRVAELELFASEEWPP